MKIFNNKKEHIINKYEKLINFLIKSKSNTFNLKDLNSKFYLATQVYTVLIKENIIYKINNSQYKVVDNINFITPLKLRNLVLNYRKVNYSFSKPEKYSNKEKVKIKKIIYSKRKSIISEEIKISDAISLLKSKGYLIYKIEKIEL